MMPAGMTIYAAICGATLARAHARSGDRIAIGSYLGGGDGFDRAMVSFADSYADQNERDYAEMKAAVRDGRIVIEEGRDRVRASRRAAQRGDQRRPEVGGRTAKAPRLLKAA